MPRILSPAREASIAAGAGRWALGAGLLACCGAAGDTIEEVTRSIREAIALHIEGMHEDGLPVPQPRTVVDYVEP